MLIRALERIDDGEQGSYFLLQPLLLRPHEIQASLFVHHVVLASCISGQALRASRFVAVTLSRSRMSVIHGKSSYSNDGPPLSSGFGMAGMPQ